MYATHISKSISQSISHDSATRAQTKQKIQKLQQQQPPRHNKRSTNSHTKKEKKFISIRPKHKFVGKSLGSFNQSCVAISRTRPTPHNNISRLIDDDILNNNKREKKEEKNIFIKKLPKQQQKHTNTPSLYDDLFFFFFFSHSQIRQLAHSTNNFNNYISFSSDCYCLCGQKERKKERRKKEREEDTKGVFVGVSSE